MMTKKEIAAVMASIANELGTWSERLRPASPALAGLLRRKAEGIEFRLKRTGFDQQDLETWHAQASGLVDAARVMLDEWHAHQRGPT